MVNAVRCLASLSLAREERTFERNLVQSYEYHIEFYPSRILLREPDDWKRERNDMTEHRFVAFCGFSFLGGRAGANEIDEAAWECLRRTESLPFQKPSTGRIAIKMVNHPGDEAMRVFWVD